MKICTVNGMNKNLLILIEFCRYYKEAEDKDRKVEKENIQGKVASKLWLIGTTSKPLYRPKKQIIQYNIFINTVP